MPLDRYDIVFVGFEYKINAYHSGGIGRDAIVSAMLTDEDRNRRGSGGTRRVFSSLFGTGSVLRAHRIVRDFFVLRPATAIPKRR